MLVNLVVNALRHSGSTEVRVEGGEGADTVLAQRRSTTGAASRPRTTRASSRSSAPCAAPRATSPASDTGLGLPFCKLAVERMGGRIALDSEPGVETTFTVVLPAG